MHAVVLTSDAQIALEERPDPVAGQGEVLIQVGAAGICGTDLHAPVMPGMFADNVVLGHEFSGTVVRGGPGAGGVEPGQPVVVNPIALSCGSCPACRRGLTNQCPAALGACSGVARDGGMAGFATADQRSVHAVPDGLTVRQAAWTEPLAVAVRAVAHGGVRPGTTVAVAGTGAIGQLILQLVLNAGAGETLVVETSRLRRDVARACGAAQAIAPGELSGVDRLYDVVFDCTGAAGAFAASVALAAPGGRVVVLGSYPSPISLAGIGREASVVFSSVYRDDREFAAALRLLARGLIDVGPLTTSVMPLASYGEAFASLRDPERAVRVFLDPAAATIMDVPVG
jgi:threonine dehydrogenase-like Zn-dependent dehydrogenase